ncbi:FabD/lysophospholipase-like protein [Imleria badia]|nr:FabD/lysophospholipase-like protein [Imleria badia]
MSPGRRARTVHNVLAIDGCGFRGRTQLLVLEELMKRHSGDTDNPSRPCDVFDLICGTAAGGLIAILLGRLEMTCDEAIRAYDFLEVAIFDESPPSLPNTPPRARTIPSLPGTRPRLDIQEILSRSDFNAQSFQRWLDWIIWSFAGKPNALMDDEKTRSCRTFVTVMNQSAVVDADAQRIRSYASPRRQDGTSDPEIVPGHAWTIRDAALGTTSCPRLFSPFKLGEYGFMAANTSGFSNPSMIAYSEALDLFGENAEVSVISLGMGLRNRHDYSSLSMKKIDQMITDLGVGVTDQRLKNLISHTQLVATSTQIKHLRLDRLIGRHQNRRYMRLEPDRATNAFIFVDYTQKPLIQTITGDFFKGFPHLLDMAVDFVQRLDLAWRELPGYTSYSGSTVDRNPRVNMSKMKPSQIMRECVLWEEANSGKHISYFTINKAGRTQSVEMRTGDFDPQQDDYSTLYVRVLLDDQWRFFSRYIVAPGDSDWTREDEESVRNPVEAILNARKNPDITAFTSDGWYTKSKVTPEHVKVENFSYSRSYQGTWVRTGMA